jgi:hypothetical protein
MRLLLEYPLRLQTQVTRSHRPLPIASVDYPSGGAYQARTIWTQM